MAREYLASGDYNGKLETILYVKKKFRTIHVCHPIEHCGFCRPGFNEPFEITESIKYSIGLLGETRNLDLGMYRIIAEIPGTTSHGIILQKYESGLWLGQLYVDGGWSGPNGMVIDWRGIHPVII